MRILLVPNSYPPQLGGLEIAVANVAKELAAGGQDVTVVTTSASTRISEETGPGGIKVYRLPFSLPRLVLRAGRAKMVESVFRSLQSPLLVPLSLLELLRILRREKPQVVNLHYVAENAFFVLAAQLLFDFGLVVTLHGSDIECYGQRSRLARRLTQATLSRADRVLSNSAHVLAQAERIVPGVKDKSAVVGNGVHPDEFAATETYPWDKPYILSVGSFSHNKGFDILVRAFAQVRDRCPGVDLIMAGDGHERQACQQLAVQLELNGAVTFLGRVDHSQVPSLLNGCEMLVLSSRNEAFGIVVLEAMAAGKPVVATRVGGVPEAVTHMENGLLVEPESPSALAEGICTLLGDPALSRRLGACAYQAVRQDYTWPKIVEKYFRAYQEAARLNDGGNE
jgi:glycosyltransferase involved in cell wall biosynthesis